MLENLVIKLATEADIPAMQQAGTTLFDYDIKLNRVQEFLNDCRHYLVLAYYNNKLVGMTSGFDYVHPDKDPILFINEASVIEKYRSKGIGRRMILFLCRHAKQLGFKESWLATEKSNIAARKAYIAAGGIEDDEPIVLINFDLKK